MSSPYNALTENDKTNIFEYLLWNSHNCGADEPYDRESKKVLSYWDKAKEHLFELLGNNLILSKKISVPFVKEVAEEEFYRNQTIQNFLNHIRRLSSVYSQSYHDWYWLSAAQKEETSLIHWLSDNNQFAKRCSDFEETSWYVTSLLRNTILDASGILDQKIDWSQNEFKSNVCYIPYSDTESIKITKGEKTMKVIGKLVRNCFPSLIDEYEEFRIAVSRLFNTSGISGDLCLSIHPLDYMTMSDNEANWSSCMSWKDEGEYRCGTVEMMNSASVVVGYLKSENTEMERGKARWNSKKWRCLFIVTRGAVVSVKGYPYANETLTKECLAWLKELYNNCPAYNDCALPEEVATLDSPYINEFRTNYMYNDFGTTTHYGYMSEDFYEFCKNGFGFNYSGVLNCMSCGEPWDVDGYDSRTRNVNCQDCHPTDEDDDDEYDETWDDYSGEYINTDDATEVCIFATSKEKAEENVAEYGYVPSTMIEYTYATVDEGLIDCHTTINLENDTINKKYNLGSLKVERTLGNSTGYYIFLKDQDYSKINADDMDFLRGTFSSSILDPIIEESKKTMAECSCS